jgi:hypothetical protein
VYLFKSFTTRLNLGALNYLSFDDIMVIVHSFFSSSGKWTKTRQKQERKNKKLSKGW